MGPVKRVLLGSAAGIFAVAGAQAADLPVKAKPVEYVRVCSLYGAGFWYVPGTDTCIKIGAYVKLDTFWGASGSGAVIGGGGAAAVEAGGRHTRTDTSDFNFRNRNDLSLDLRSQTEYGTLRSYLDIGSQLQTSSANNNLSPVTGTSTIYVTRAFLQFAGFTAGRMRSFFDMYFQGNYSLAQQRMNGDTTPNGIAGIAYTYQLGGGLSASFSLEDGGFATGGHGRSTADANVVPFTLVAQTSDVKGQQFFDPVFNLRIDQAWGFAGVSAALHDASGGYYTSFGCVAPNLNTEQCGHPSDKLGWAVTAAFTLTNVFGLAGDTLGGQAVFSRGAVGYASTNFGPQIFFSGHNVGLGFAADGVFANGTNVELIDVTTANAAYEHRWSPQWRTSAYAGWIDVNFDGAARNIVCNNGAFSFAPTNCSPNWSMWQVGSRTMWNPVPDLDVGLDVSFYHLNTAFGGGTINLAAPLGAKPTGTYTVSNQDAVAAFFRIQRNFLY